MYDTWHVADAPVPVRPQVPVNVPAPLLPTVTVPPGVIAVPGEVSCTVTVHIVAEPTATGDGEQVTDVVVLRCVTVIVLVPWLAL